MIPHRLAVRVLLVALPVSFFLGALSHAGVRIPLGLATIDEPTIVPAAVVEGFVALGFVVAAVADAYAHPAARRLFGLALHIGIAGVLLGMLALALGRGTRSELNDVFHVVVLVTMLVALRLTEATPSRACRHGSRLARRAA